jgi:hypothetical protein
MCHRSKNLANRLNRHRLGHHRRYCRRRPTQCSASRRPVLHRHRRCSAKANLPRANPRQAVKCRQSHSDRTNRRHSGHRSTPRSRPRRHRTDHPRRRPSRQTRLASLRRPGYRRLVIHPSCRPMSRHLAIRSAHPTDRPTDRLPWNHPGCPGKKTRKRKKACPRSHRRPDCHRWACCWRSRPKSRRHWSPTIRRKIRRSRRWACCSKASTKKRIVVGDSRP